MEHIPKITIQAIPHEKQRYPTAGDWVVEADGSINIFVSQMSYWKHELAVALHELVEVLDCQYMGISQVDVDNFDLAFEVVRSKFPEIIGDAEPGDMNKAPYKHSHDVATVVEKAYIVDGEKMSWASYEQDINKLYEKE